MDNDEAVVLLDRHHGQLDAPTVWTSPEQSEVTGLRVGLFDDRRGDHDVKSVRLADPVPSGCLAEPDGLDHG